LQFSYTHCTETQLLDHVALAKRASVTAARRYYLERGHDDLVSRIDRARLQARINRLTKTLTTQQ
jgi:hypothetical protein